MQRLYASLQHYLEALCHVNLTVSYVPLWEDLEKGLRVTCSKMVEEQDMKEHEEFWNSIPWLLGIQLEGWGANGSVEDGAALSGEQST